MARQRRADMFLALEDDPREIRPALTDERTTLLEFLRSVRLTLEMKCAGLDAEAMARRSVEPSTMSFRTVMAGDAAGRLYCSPDERDGDFDGAVPDPDVVAEAWASWRAEAEFTDRFIAGAASLDVTAPVRGGVGPGEGPVALREVVLNLIHEYARHLGHADLLRERIDGRIGQ